MSSEVIIAICSLIGTAIGAFAGSWQTRRLIAYRIEQLEKKVDKHNSVVERVFVLERDEKTIFNKLGELREDVRDIQKGA